MTLSSAIGNLFQSVMDIISAIIHSILAVLQAVFAVIQGFFSFLWSNIGLLLVIGFAILIYQVFVVDKGRGPAAANNKIGGGRKKVT